MIHPDIGCLGDAPRPFFSASLHDGRVVTAGDASCSLGERLEHAGTHGHEGIFASWHWDGESLTATNDRYGIYPLFYSHYGNELRISPSIARILEGKVPRTLDYAALAVIFRLGHCVGDDTPFEHIRVLPPASTLTWRAGELQITANGSESRFGARQQIDFDTAVDQYIALFDQAVARRLPRGDRFTVPLSGGRDSRHILLSLEKQGIKPSFCPTLQYRPPATNDDMRIAGLLTQAMGIEHVQVARPASWFDAVLKDVHLTHYCGGGHSWSLPLAAHLRGRVDTLYDGLAGSVLSGGFMLDEARLALVRDGKFVALAEQLVFGSKKEGYNNTVMTKDFLARAPRELAAERVAKELARHADAGNPLLSFIFWNRTRRMVGMIPYAIMSDVPTVHCPYLDHDVFDFLTTIDPVMFLDNKLHDAAIRRGYPAFADIPFEDKTKRAAMDADAHAYYRNSIKQFWRYLLKRGVRPSRFVRTGYLLPRVFLDLCKRRNALPWYLMSTVHALELENALD